MEQHEQSTVDPPTTNNTDQQQQTPPVKVPKKRGRKPGSKSQKTLERERAIASGLIPPPQKGKPGRKKRQPQPDTTEQPSSADDKQQQQSLDSLGKTKNRKLNSPKKKLDKADDVQSNNNNNDNALPTSQSTEIQGETWELHNGDPDSNEDAWDDDLPALNIDDAILQTEADENSILENNSLNNDKDKINAIMNQLTNMHYPLELFSVCCNTFKKVIETISQLLDRFTMQFTPKGMSIIGLDVKRYAMVIARFPAANFEYYKCDGEYNIALNTQIFKSFIMHAHQYNIFGLAFPTEEIARNGTQITLSLINCAENSFARSVIPHMNSRGNPKIPNDLVYPQDIYITASILKDKIHQLSTVAKKLKVQTNYNEIHLTALKKGKGETWLKLRAEPKQDDDSLAQGDSCPASNNNNNSLASETMEILNEVRNCTTSKPPARYYRGWEQARYMILYLKDMFKATILSKNSQVHIQFKPVHPNDPNRRQPIIFNFPITNFGVLTYLLNAINKEYTEEDDDEDEEEEDDDDDDYDDEETNNTSAAEQSLAQQPNS